MILYYKIWRWLLIAFLYFQVKKKIYIFIKDNYSFYKSNKINFLLIVLNEILLKLIEVYANQLHKQYKKAKKYTLKDSNYNK